MELKSHFPNFINTLLVVQEGSDAPWKYPLLKHHVRSAVVKDKHQQGGYTHIPEPYLLGIPCFPRPLESYSISQHPWNTSATLFEITYNWQSSDIRRN